MKYTLLDLTQEILASMDSDEVNSITDTTEALQVARLVRQAYYDLVEDVKLPSHYTTFELNPSVDPSKPILMTIPDGINKVEWVKYNIQDITETATNYVTLSFIPKETFFERMYHLNSSETGVLSCEFPSTNSSSITLYFRTDKAPEYYTSIDNNTLLFDSYNSDVDSTLQKSKTVAYGRKNISFTLDDATTPDLDDALFTRLLNDAKELCFAELKSVTHAIAGRNSKRSRSRSYHDKFRAPKISDFDELPYYGRK